MMTPAKKSEKPIDQAVQIDRFRETARQLECDEDQERFEKKLGKIAKAKTAPRGKGTARN
jgi:hypothetical protein